MSKDRQIGRAVVILRSGGLVAFPTETVYGLGADATNAAAARRIFAVKGRPPTNPLIVHVADKATARRYTRRWPGEAEKLAQEFWPGPLTLVLPKATTIVPEATAGLDTVGLRCPNHPLALELLRSFRGPIAAPSANRSNRLSPTTAEHVRRELGEAVELVLDGGPCQVGIESTVLDLATERPVILRPGSVARQQIEAVIGSVGISAGSVSRHEPARSPGQQEVHYAPRTPAWRFSRDRQPEALQWLRQHPNEAAAIVAIGEELDLSIPSPHRVLIMPAQAHLYARRLYSVLHELDNCGLSAILIELPPEESQWFAVRDRLIRATRELSSYGL